jgi:hypothetical protein
MMDVPPPVTERYYTKQNAEHGYSVLIHSNRYGFVKSSAMICPAVHSVDFTTITGLLLLGYRKIMRLLRAAR